MQTLFGARVEEMFETTKSLANAFHVSKLILHVGTNNVATRETSLIEKQIVSLCDQGLADCPLVTSITFSSVIQRKIFHNDLREKTIELTKQLRALTHRRDWGFIDNSSNDPFTHLGNDGVHLNVNYGTKTFASLLSGHIDRHSATDKPSTASQDMSQPHRHASPLYEDITSPPARRSYADIASQSPLPPISRYPERHWSEVNPWSMPSAGELYARNAFGYTHQRSTTNEQGYHCYAYTLILGASTVEKETINVQIVDTPIN